MILKKITFYWYIDTYIEFSLFRTFSWIVCFVLCKYWNKYCSQFSFDAFFFVYMILIKHSQMCTYIEFMLCHNTWLCINSPICIPEIKFEISFFFSSQLLVSQGGALSVIVANFMYNPSQIKWFGRDKVAQKIILILILGSGSLWGFIVSHPPIIRINKCHKIVNYKITFIF